MRPYSSIIHGLRYTCFRGHSMPIHHMVTWVTPQIFLEVKQSDVFMNKMFSWKFQHHSSASYGSKVIITWTLPKIRQNCLPSAANKILPTLVSFYQGKKQLCWNLDALQSSTQISHFCHQKNVQNGKIFQTSVDIVYITC